MIDRRRPRALVLSGELPFEKLISEMMTTVNWECEVVTNPEEAMARLKDTPYDVVITDYRLSLLSQINGLHFICCLRREGITVPAIVILEDGEVLRTVPKDLLSIPAVLHKPFTASELRGVLDAVWSV
jgi:DNA-binding response OmpR family regulator